MAILSTSQTRHGDLTVVTVAEQREKSARTRLPLSPDGSAPSGSAQLPTPVVGPVVRGGRNDGLEGAVVGRFAAEVAPRKIIGYADFTHVNTTAVPYRRIGIAQMYDPVGRSILRLHRLVVRQQ